jgi:hypothetical protein
MQYHIVGRLSRSQDVLQLPHADFVQLLQEKVVPSFKILIGDIPHGKVLAGGLPAGGRDIYMIVDLHAEDSHRCVRQFLASLPISPYYDWEVTPLETFEEMVRSFGN